MDDEIKRFVDSTDWADYSRVDFGLVAGVQSDGLFPLGGRIVLARDAEPPPLELRTESNHFVVLRGSDTVEALRCALESGPTPLLRLGGHTLSLADRYGHHSSSSAMLATDHGERRIGWPARTLTLSHMSRWHYLQNSRLEPSDEHFGGLSPVPFASLASALQFMGVEPDLNLASVLSIYAPIYARLDEPQLDVESARVSVVVDSLLEPIASDMRLTFSFRLQGLPPIVASAQTWHQTSARTWQVDAILPIDSTWADVSLSARGRNICRRYTYAPSLPVQAHAVLSGGQAWLLKLLQASDGKHREQMFERGVVALLALGRIPAVPYGHNGLDRYVDFVAFAGEERVLVGECTIETPSADKMAKLRGRTEELRSRLHVGEKHLIVQSVVVAPISMSTMPQEVADKARDLGVSLLWGDRVGQLLTRIVAGDSPAQVFDRIRYFAH